MIRALIVDDEPIARRRIRRLLTRHADVSVVGEAGDGASAVTAIKRDRPDLVFLDVQMPERNGFDVIAAVGPARMPAVIFTTAFDDYALRAFDVHALDYLLKPFSRERFEAAVARARSVLERGQSAERLRALLGDVRRDAPPDRLLVKSGGRIVFVRLDDVDRFEAADNYVRVHAGRDTHVVRQRLSQVEAILDPRRFARIHRSTIVNVERIKELQPWFRGDYVVILTDGTKLTLSRTYRDQVLKRWDRLHR